MYKKVMAALVGLVFAFAAAPTGTADVVALDAAENRVSTENHVFNEFVCEQSSTLDALVSDPENAFPARCDNGEFVRDAIGLSHGFSLVPYAAESWTGTFESWIRHEAGEIGFRIVFDNGAIVESGTLPGGTWPPIGQVFTHECLAFDTDTELPIAWHDFGCNISGPLFRQ